MIYLLKMDQLQEHTIHRKITVRSKNVLHLRLIEMTWNCTWKIYGKSWIGRNTFKIDWEMIYLLKMDHFKNTIHRKITACSKKLEIRRVFTRGNILLEICIPDIKDISRISEV